jgi:hypothetical protein
MRRRASILAATLLSFWLAPSAALAAPDKACFQAYEAGQTKRADKKLLEARAALTTCVASCPAALAKDCSTWLGEVDKDLASLVVEVEGATDARVSIDGAGVAAGAEIALEPGEHEVRVESAEHTPETARVSLKVGEKKHVTRVTMTAKAPNPTPPATTPAPPPPPLAPPASTPAPTQVPAPRRTVEKERPMPVETLLFGGVGVLSLTGFAVFGATNLAKRNQLDASGCKPACSVDKTRSIANGFLVADTFLGAGITSLAIATTLYLVRPDVVKQTGLYVTADGLGARF